MDICAIGVPTYHTRVEAWECDHNQHWNVRNYLRAFQHARGVVGDMCGAPMVEEGPVTFHSRFHRELFLMSAVEIRSAILADGEYAGALVHVLSSEGRLAATSFEQPGFVSDALPKVAAEDLRLALPRGVDGAPLQPGVATPAHAVRTEQGFVHPREVDHTGSLGNDRVTRRVAAASNTLLCDVGFTPAYTQENAISRMGVETKYTRFAPIPTGTRIISYSWISHVGRKNLIIHHRMVSPDGTELLAADQGLVFVDMNKRRSIEVPDLLRSTSGT